MKTGASTNERCTWSNEALRSVSCSGIKSRLRDSTCAKWWDTRVDSSGKTSGIGSTSFLPSVLLLTIVVAIVGVAVVVVAAGAVVERVTVRYPGLLLGLLALAICRSLSFRAEMNEGRWNDEDRMNDDDAIQQEKKTIRTDFQDVGFRSQYLTICA
ncbi:hypothetical protein Tco_1405169 [Tanacetum coccineum]